MVYQLPLGRVKGSVCVIVIDGNSLRVVALSCAAPVPLLDAVGCPADCKVVDRLSAVLQVDSNLRFFVGDDHAVAVLLAVAVKTLLYFHDLIRPAVDRAGHYGNLARLYSGFFDQCQSDLAHHR